MSNTIPGKKAATSGRMHKSQIAKEQGIAVREAAHASDFILEMPKGADTAAGKPDKLLSFAQKQNHAHHRGIAKDAPILVLDETAHALDPEAEKDCPVGYGEYDKRAYQHTCSLPGPAFLRPHSRSGRKNKGHGRSPRAPESSPLYTRLDEIQFGEK